MEKLSNLVSQTLISRDYGYDSKSDQIIQKGQDGGHQTLTDPLKILKMSKVFQVSVDYQHFVSNETNYLYDESFFPVIKNSTYDQQFLSTGTNSLYGQSFFPILTNYAYDQQFISMGTNSASDQHFVSMYMKTQIVLLSYYPLAYQNLHTYYGYFHALCVNNIIPTGTLTQTKSNYVYVTGYSIYRGLDKLINLVFQTSCQSPQ